MLELDMNYFPASFMSLGILWILSGCGTNPEIFKVGPDVYTVTTVGDTGFVSLGKLKAEAYRQAEDKATQLGKDLEVISVSEVPAGFAKWPQVEVRFRLLSKGVAASRSESLQNRNLKSFGYDADGRPTSLETIVQEGNLVKPLKKADDRYEQLKKIADLRASGILTEEEFETEKKKILQRTD